jgi:pyruvate dehydrogenase E2 component (dihydrolipoamide acetyltransferase)
VSRTCFRWNSWRFGNEDGRVATPGRADDGVGEQPLLEVETQKATSDVPAPAAGFVRQLCVSAGQTVDARALVCILTDTADEPLDAVAIAAEPPAQPTSGAPAPAATAAVATPAAEGNEAVRASPVARRVARELGVNLATVVGSGPGGRIIDDDVRRAAVAPAPAAPVQAAQGEPTAESSEWTPMPATRLALNEQMRKSLAEIPQIHLQRQLDVTQLVVKAPGVTFTHRLVAAAARALVKHPTLRSVTDGRRTRMMPVSVAVAMDTRNGLVAPAVRDPHRCSLAALATTLTELRDRANAGGLRMDELKDAPFAITNLGMIGIDFFDAFVFHGQTAVLSVGRTTDGPAGRKLAWVGLALDHRVVDGAEGARFLVSLQAEALAADGGPA